MSTSAPDEAGEIEAAVAVWHRISHRDSAAALDALLGIGRAEARQIERIVGAASPEVAAMLEALPGLWRRLDQATTTRLTTSSGGLRGPVQWSETMSARSTSGGAQDVVVFSEPFRSVDTPLNRLLVSILDDVRLAGSDASAADRLVRSDEEASVVTRARQAGIEATAALQHQSLRLLATTRTRRWSERDILRAHRARAAPRYGPVLAAHAALRRPLDPRHLGWLLRAATPGTRGRLVLLDAALGAIEARGAVLAPITVHDGALVSGPVRYLPDRPDRQGAILLGDVAIDRPPPGHEAEPGAVAARLAGLSPAGVARVVTGADTLQSAVDDAEQRLTELRLTSH